MLLPPGKRDRTSPAIPSRSSSWISFGKTYLGIISSRPLPLGGKTMNPEDDGLVPSTPILQGIWKRAAHPLRPPSGTPIGPLWPGWPTPTWPQAWPSRDALTNGSLTRPSTGDGNGPQASSAWAFVSPLSLRPTWTPSTRPGRAAWP